MPQKNKPHLALDDFALLGRSFDEYRRMFRLDAVAPGRAAILDVASGVSSFCAEAWPRGYRVTATDRVYGAGAAAIELKSHLDLVNVVRQLPALRRRYRWDYFRDIAALKAQRETAAALFIEDFRRHGPSRYVPVEYPRTGFKDDRFDIALVSHFLFLYDDRLSYRFHQATLTELLRVAREVRIFPIVNLQGSPSSAVGALMSDPGFYHCRIGVEKSDYEFIRGGREMMVIRRD